MKVVSRQQFEAMLKPRLSGWGQLQSATSKGLTNLTPTFREDVDKVPGFKCSFYMDPTSYEQKKADWESWDPQEIAAFRKSCLHLFYDYKNSREVYYTLEIINYRSIVVGDRVYMRDGDYRTLMAVPGVDNSLERSAAYYAKGDDEGESFFSPANRDRFCRVVHRALQVNGSGHSRLPSGQSSFEEAKPQIASFYSGWLFEGIDQLQSIGASVARARANTQLPVLESVDRYVQPLTDFSAKVSVEKTGMFSKQTVVQLPSKLNGDLKEAVIGHIKAKLPRIKMSSRQGNIAKFEGDKAAEINAIVQSIDIVYGDKGAHIEARKIGRSIG